MSGEAPQVPLLIVGETRNGKFSFANKLDTGELLTGSPTITEINTTDLTIANAAVSTGSLTINGASVSAGQALTFKVTGFSADKQYRLLFQCGTDSTPAQTLRAIGRFVVAAST